MKCITCRCREKYLCNKEQTYNDEYYLKYDEKYNEYNSKNAYNNHTQKELVIHKGKKGPRGPTGPPGRRGSSRAGSRRPRPPACAAAAWFHSAGRW